MGRVPVPGPNDPGSSPRRVQAITTLIAFIFFYNAQTNFYIKKDLLKFISRSFFNKHVERVIMPAYLLHETFTCVTYHSIIIMLCNQMCNQSLCSYSIVAWCDMKSRWP